jgi:hypothetical protein
MSMLLMQPGSCPLPLAAGYLTCLPVFNPRRFWWHEQGKQQQQQEPEVFDTMRRHWGF